MGAVVCGKRKDLKNKKQTPSCVLELAGIGAAISHFLPYIQDVKGRLVIVTDSNSAVKAYNKFLETKIPTNNMRFSSFLAS